MANKKIFVLGILFIFLFSFVCSATSTEVTTTTNESYAQSFAQINASLIQLANQISAFKTQDENFQATVMLKSDLPQMYDTLTKHLQSVEQQIIVDNLIIVVLAFSIFFLLIGKNLLPVHSKEDKETKEKENKELLKENDALRKQIEKLIAPQTKKGLFGLFKNKNNTMPPARKETKPKEETKKVPTQDDIIVPEPFIQEHGDGI